MDLELADRVALVGGATRGIGLAIARGFAREGAHVALVGRTREDLDRARGECQALNAGRTVLALQADLTVPSDAERAVAEVVATLGRLDVVVANAGTGSVPGGWEVTSGDWDAALRMNLGTGMALSRAALPVLVGARAGAITFVGSIAGWEAIGAPLTYSAAKAALIAAMKQLSRDVGMHGVRINAVVPGNVLFPGGSWERKLERGRERVEAYVATEVPLRRFGTPAEIADATLFLSSARASFVTGACLVVDGGQTRST